MGTVLYTASSVRDFSSARLQDLYTILYDTCFHASTREFLQCVYTCVPVAYVHTCILIYEHKGIHGKTTHSWETRVPYRLRYGIAKRHTGEKKERGEGGELEASRPPVETPELRSTVLPTTGTGVR